MGCYAIRIDQERYCTGEWCAYSELCGEKTEEWIVCTQLPTQKREHFPFYRYIGNGRWEYNPDRFTKGIFFEEKNKKKRGAVFWKF